MIGMSEAHRERRKRYLGASEVPAVLGDSPFANAADIYYQKTGELDGWTGNDATEAGQVLEDALIRWASRKLNLKVKRNQWRVHEGKILAATLDALILDAPAALECKTSGLFNAAFDSSEWGDEMTDAVPAPVYLQAQAQMLVAELETIFVPALLGGGRGLVLYRIDRHAEVPELILEHGERFWREHVEKRVPPPDEVPSIEVLKRIRREPESSVNVDDDVISAFLQASELAKEAKKAEEAAKARLIEALGTAEAGLSNLATVTYLEQSRTSIDSKRLKAEQPEVFEAYSTSTTYRVLRTKAIKKQEAA